MSIETHWQYMKLSSKVLWSTITCPVPLTFSRGCWFPQLLQRQCVAFVMKAFSGGLSLYANYHLNRGRNQANEYLACNYWNYCLVLRSWHISRITFLSSRIRVECIRRIACYDFVCMTPNRLVAWISNYITKCAMRLLIYSQTFNGATVEVWDWIRNFI